MSTPLPVAWMRDLSRLEADERVTTAVIAIASRLASYADKDGSNVRPGNDRLAQETRSSVPTVKRATDLLQRLGWLVLVARGRYRTSTPANVYRLEWPPSLKAGRGLTHEPSSMPNEGSRETERGLTDAPNEGSPMSHYLSSDLPSDQSPQKPPQGGRRDRGQARRQRQRDRVERVMGTNDAHWAAGGGFMDGAPSSNGTRADGGASPGEEWTAEDRRDLERVLASWPEGKPVPRALRDLVASTEGTAS